MSDGRLQELGPPQEVYDRPANVFVAGFIGSPPMNLLRGRAREGRVTAGDFSCERAGVADGEVIVGVRPGSLRPAVDRAAAVARLDPQDRNAEGSVIRLAINPAKVHLFDGATGQAIH